jgi:hypothetical protein
VVCQPTDTEFILDLARHGFRLMLVHSDDQFIQDFRRTLRGEGLSSQLMGASRAKAGEVPSLAKGFYELILLCPESDLTLDDLRFALGPGGTIVSSRSFQDANLKGFVPVTLPEGFQGYRLR